jgi:hypothetical protein
MTSAVITLIETPLALLRSKDGETVNAFRTNYPKISQLIVAGLLRSRLPELGIQPEIRFVDMKGRDPKKIEPYGTVRYGGVTLDKLRVGMSFDDVRDVLLDSDIVGLTANFTQEANVVCDFTKFVKSVTNATVIVGGSDAIARPAHYLANGADVVILGEGENVGPRAIAALMNDGDLSTVDGIAYVDESSIRNHGQPKAQISMEDVAYPALDLAQLDEYYEDHEGTLPHGVRAPLIYFESSRGCKMVCNFCTTPYLRKGYRYMTTECIRQWLNFFRGFEITTILLTEDNILSRLHYPGGRAEILEIFRLLREGEFAWEFSTGFEIGKLANSQGALDYELIEAMFSCRMDSERFIGCYRSFVPIESLRDDGPKKFKKLRAWDVEKEILRAIAQAGLPAFGYGIMIGFVDDSPDTLSLTASRCEELREACSQANPSAVQHFQIFNNILLPGTPNFTKNLRHAKYNVEDHPELFNFYTSTLDGLYFKHWDYYNKRQNLAAALNGQDARRNWANIGKYY